MNLTSQHLIGYAIKYHGNVLAIKKAIKYQEPILAQSAQAITLLQPNYPQAFKQLENPPYVLFYHGNIELLNYPSCGVVGSRQPTTYAIDATKQLVKTFSKKMVIVSGLAKGIDAIAHQQACIYGSTIAILGCGINRIYPSENRQLTMELRKSQLVLSEYPDFVAPYPKHFLARNRLIAALSNPLFVMAATYRSGTMSTVNEALSLSKDIYCLPYPINEPTGLGCNLLISAGANILTNVTDLGII